jgi:hypothetical protein
VGGTATVGAVGTDLCLIDAAQYAVGERGTMEGAASIHLRFDYNETAFRWVIRHDGIALWDAAVQPRVGTTQSPFVALPYHA